MWWKEHDQEYKSCIYQLANLTIKAELERLPIDLDQLFVDIFYHYFHSSKYKQDFQDNQWASSHSETLPYKMA